jgi:hypothetical protein
VEFLKRWWQRFLTGYAYVLAVGIILIVVNLALLLLFTFLGIGGT